MAVQTFDDPQEYVDMFEWNDDPRRAMLSRLARDYRDGEPELWRPIVIRVIAKSAVDSGVGLVQKFERGGEVAGGGF